VCLSSRGHLLCTSRDWRLWRDAQDVYSSIAQSYGIHVALCVQPTPGYGLLGGCHLVATLSPPPITPSLASPLAFNRVSSLGTRACGATLSVYPALPPPLFAPSFLFSLFLARAPPLGNTEWNGASQNRCARYVRLPDCLPAWCSSAILLGPPMGSVHGASPPWPHRHFLTRMACPCGLNGLCSSSTICYSRAWPMNLDPGGLPGRQQ